MVKLREPYLTCVRQMLSSHGWLLFDDILVHLAVTADVGTAIVRELQHRHLVTTYTYPGDGVSPAIAIVVLSDAAPPDSQIVRAARVNDYRRWGWLDAIIDLHTQMNPIMSAETPSTAPASTAGAKTAAPDARSRPRACQI